MTKELFSDLKETTGCGGTVRFTVNNETDLLTHWCFDNCNALIDANCKRCMGWQGICPHHQAKVEKWTKRLERLIDHNQKVIENHQKNIDNLSIRIAVKKDEIEEIRAMEEKTLRILKENQPEFVTDMTGVMVRVQEVMFESRRDLNLSVLSMKDSIRNSRGSIEVCQNKIRGYEQELAGKTI